MLSYNKIFESSNGEFSLALEIETLDFDFNKNERKVRVILLARNDFASDVSAESNKIGYLNIFGSIFNLPADFQVIPNTETAILDVNEFIISNTLYKEGAEFEIALEYFSENIGLEPTKISGEITFFPIPRYPYCTISNGRNITLGDIVTITGGLLDEGYTLHFDVFDGENILYSKDLTKDDSTFNSDPAWAEGHPDVASFDIRFVFSGWIGGIVLPETSYMTVTCAVPETDGLPSANISLKYIYDDPAFEVFNVPIVNRCKTRIAISDITCYQGATVESFSVRFSGSRIYAMSADFRATAPGWQNWDATIVDSRGLERKYSGRVYVYEYGPPDFEAKVERRLVDGSPSESVAFTVTPILTYPLSGDNSYSYAYRLRNCSEGDFGGWISFQSESETVINDSMELNNIYELQIRASDLAGLSTIHTYTVNCTRTDLHIGRNRLGIGKKCATLNTVECAWDIKCDGDISFTDAEGNQISLRDMLGISSAVMSLDSDASSSLTYRVYEAETESEISNIVNNKIINDNNCAFALAVIFVDADGLSLERGAHIYAVARKNSISSVKKIN